MTMAASTDFGDTTLVRQLVVPPRCTVPVVDVDAFKHVNERFGHSAGDEVLQWFFGCAVSGIREGSDWIARTDWDEFVVILPEANLPQSVAVAHKLRQTFVERPIVTCAGVLHCTISIDSAALETAQDLATICSNELLRAADRADAPCSVLRGRGKNALN